ncbi:unnamed protein product [Rotaria socialis]|uniref:Uncharacterized protein n=1 Tax=Rotaria socialis TaxID=392032 RepID=A0A817WDN3_9BILA|nr:unnamed protein product [Rotaria socialis]CAF3405010.1 unnamed protein product [Rotaria socialis]CAF4107040.1 unnamed protein product [Rotaria socialis]CAF4253645.1 unnamed protein product [Rotaria socialis]CAF4458886.1 unnamed protein product [Rotaria socialis]
MATVRKSNFNNNDNHLSSPSYIMNKRIKNAIEQVDRLNYEKSKVILKENDWLPINCFNENKAIDLRTDYKVTDFKTSNGQTDPNNSLTKLKKKKNFSQNSPLLSTEHIGIRTNAVKHSSNHCRSHTDSTIVLSKDKLGLSSQQFKSSDDILRYLKLHPDFQRMPPSQLQPILAAILSGLIFIGGVALIVVSGGTATPGIILSTSLLIEFAKRNAVSAGLTIITFGAGYGAGNLMGIVLVGTGLTETSIQTLGTITGAIVGSGIRTGSYCVLTKIEGTPIETLQLVLEGVGGAIAGRFAGYLCVKASLILKNPILPGEEVLRCKAAETEILVSRGDGLDSLEEMDLGRLFGEVVPQDAFDVANGVLQRFIENPDQYFPTASDELSTTIFQDKGGKLTQMLADRGIKGSFRFYEFDVGAKICGFRRPDRIVIVFTSNYTSKLHELTKGYEGAFYTAFHYRTGSFIRF